MSESPYTGYVEKWSSRFDRLMRAKAQFDAADKAFHKANDERNKAQEELNSVQQVITGEFNEEIDEAPAGTFWHKGDRSANG